MTLKEFLNTIGIWGEVAIYQHDFELQRDRVYEYNPEDIWDTCSNWLEILINDLIPESFRNAKVISIEVRKDYVLCIRVEPIAGDEE